MIRLLVVFSCLLFSLPSWAGGIAVVDMQRAVTETNEGKSAIKTVEAMFAERQAELTRLQGALQKAAEEYKAKEPLLNDDSRMQAQRSLQQKEYELQSTAVQFEQEMSQAQMGMMQQLGAKMKEVAQKIGTEKGYDLVIDASIAYHVGSGVTDITDALIQRYNTK